MNKKLLLSLLSLVIFLVSLNATLGTCCEEKYDSCSSVPYPHCGTYGCGSSSEFTGCSGGTISCESRPHQFCENGCEWTWMGGDSQSCLGDNPIPCDDLRNGSSCSDSGCTVEQSISCSGSLSINCEPSGDSCPTGCNEIACPACVPSEEICDDVDNDCDGFIDEGVKTKFYMDADSDGFGDSSSSFDACSKPAGYVLDNTDCDDGRHDPLNDCSCAFECTPKFSTCSSVPVYDCSDYGCLGGPATFDECLGPLDLLCIKFPGDDCKLIDGCEFITEDKCSAGTFKCEGQNKNACEVVSECTTVMTEDGCTGTIETTCSPDALSGSCGSECRVKECYKTCYEDADSDGFGNAASSVYEEFCPTGYVLDNTDCDDGRHDPLNDCSCAFECDLNFDSCVEIPLEDCSDYGCAGGSDKFDYCDDSSYGSCSVFSGTGLCDSITGCIHIISSICVYDTYPYNFCTSNYDGSCPAGCVIFSDEDKCSGTFSCLGLNEDACSSAELKSVCIPILSPVGCTKSITSTCSPDALSGSCGSSCHVKSCLNECYLDEDGDGYGKSSESMLSSPCPADFVSDKTDCNDENSAIHINIFESTYGEPIYFDNDQNACCADKSYCNSDSTCYSPQSAGTTYSSLNHDGTDDIAHCYNGGGVGKWLDCDQADFMDYWCGNVCGAKQGVKFPRDADFYGDSNWNADYSGERFALGEYPAGPGGSLECCGDDPNENHRWEQTDDSMGAVTGAACCDLASDCVAMHVGNATCYDDSSTFKADGDTDTDYCDAGIWRDCLDSENIDLSNVNCDVGNICSTGSCCLGSRYYEDSDLDGWSNKLSYQDNCFDPGAGWVLSGSELGVDCDDTDANYTYECCGANNFLIQKRNYFGDYTSATIDDWAYDNVNKPLANFDFDKYRGACAFTSDFCVIDSDYLDTNGLVVASKQVYDGSSDGYDMNMYCSADCDAYGCSWVDFDSDKITCEITGEYTWSIPNASFTDIGEYNSVVNECCGDDVNENITTVHCSGSTTKESIVSMCCPADGQQWFIQDNECATSCPDIMNTPPTFIPLASSSNMWKGYDAALTGPPYDFGYCCDGTIDSEKPLCNLGEEGCYTQLGIPGASDDDVGTKYYCQETNGDNNCMVETCLNNYKYELCEEITVCNETVNLISDENADQKLRCDNYTKINIDSAYKAYTLTDDCSDSPLISNCETKEITISEPNDLDSCYALCLKDKHEEPYACKEICTGYTEKIVTIYTGPNCTMVSDCREEIEIFDSEQIEVEPYACQDFGNCNQFGCTTSSEENCTEYGCPPSTIYEKSVIECHIEYVCEELPCTDGNSGLGSSNKDLYCFKEISQNGNPLVLNVTNDADDNLQNTMFICSSEDNIEQGDPICEYQIGGDILEYKELEYRCVANPALCDWSSVTGEGIPIEGKAESGCQNITETKDDSWGLYNSACVSRGFDSPTDNIYSQSCCYAYSINDFDLYDNALDYEGVIAGIKVY